MAGCCLFVVARFSRHLDDCKPERKLGKRPVAAAIIGEAEAATGLSTDESCYS